MLVIFSKKFAKQKDKAPSNIQVVLRERIKLFNENMFHPLLNNHALIGEYKGYMSINITGDWRAIYSKFQDKNGEMIIVFELIGTHSQLYK